jgi:alginate O-acetyltransferase complex protein AlgI
VLFNSFEFIFVFLPVSFFIYFYLNKKKLLKVAKVFLVLTSLFFYSWWNIAYLPLIIISILFNYTINKSMINCVGSSNLFYSKKTLLKVGLIFNIGLLVYFKYMDFFISNTNSLINADIELLNLALPLAISFFTLQQIAYTVDTYEGLVKERNFLDYAIFVSFFPQLIAGPIVHHKEMMPQFANIRNKVINYKNIAMGLFIFSIGIFKKVIIADTFAQWASFGFDSSTTLNFIEAWATSLSYTFQLYFDFSGYSDMAIGAALLFNVRLPQNFNSPYKAISIIDFWQRWHITLSKFITTYIYTPIIKSFRKLTFEKAMFATFITFLIAGLWHGASWMFIIFGLLHGAGLIINQYWKKYWKKKSKININKQLSWFITFNYINITFVFFRANDWTDAKKVLGGMFDLKNIILPKMLESKLPFLNNYGIEFGVWARNINGGMLTIVWIIIGFAIILLFRNSMEKLYSFEMNYKTVFFSSIFFIISVLSLSRVTEFLYFNF